MVHRLVIHALRQVVRGQKELTNVILQMINGNHLVKEGDEWLHTEDVMLIFKKCPKTIYNWRRTGAIRCEVRGGTPYYLKSDIYKFLAQRNKAV